MNPTPVRFVALLCACVFTAPLAPAAEFAWSGIRVPAKISAEDGVTKLGVKIGKFVALPDEALFHALAQVHAKFPGSRPWATLGVGEVPDAPAFMAEQIESFLTRADAQGVDVFLELWPRKTTDVPAEIERWLGKLKTHRSVKGLGIDLEFYQGGGATDEAAKLWDEKIKAQGAGYRMFLKHWDVRHLPKTYRGRGDILFIDTSSEESVDALVADHAKWAAHFAPNPVAFQIGYPADEDDMKGSKEGGWWKLRDPIKEWGEALRAKVGATHPQQEISLIWICVKSGKSYNPGWDLTRAAKP